jgi:carbamoyl-phosphate synthase small subunit
VDVQGIDSLEITHINLNDQTLEGFRHTTKPIMAVQYHPESAPGPHDSRYFFARFKEMLSR